ncbi:MAG: carbohydrate ABC transporter permease [Chloroflexota bacterium]|nr:carbohydrate ABC transporter permease [Chloroflexota bacterium]
MALAPAPLTVADNVAMTRRRRLARTARRAGYYLLVILVCAVTFSPIYWMVVTTIRPVTANLRFPPQLWPTAIDLSAFRALFDHEPIEQWIWNSTLLSLMATLICVVLAVLGAYTLSSMRWRGRGAFAIFLLMTQMLPEALIIVPIFKIYRDLGLRESLPGLSLIDAAFVLPIGIWILKNMFDTIPKEVQEAARVDGAGPFRVLFQIVLPLTLPGLVAVGVVAFFYTWNEFLFAQSMIADDSLKPASVGLASMISMLDTPIERLLAAGLIFAIPPVIFYVVMQRYVIAGITAGAVKG